MALELTEREMAIARGENPDEVAPKAKDEKASDEKPEAEESEQDEDEEVVAEESGKGKEAKGAKDGAAARSDEDDEEEDEDEEEEEPVKPAPKSEAKSKAKAKQKPKAEEADAEEEELDLDPEKYAQEGYDDDTVKLVKYTKKLKDELSELRESVKQVQQLEAKRQHQRQLDDFHEACDSLPEEIVGRSVDKSGEYVKLAEKASEARKQIWEKATELYNSEVKKALRVAKKNNTDPEFPDLREITKNAAEVVFAKQLREIDRKKIRQEIEDQSKKRRPAAGGSARREFVPIGEKRTDVDPVKAMANDPRIVKFWEKAQEENGSK